MEPVSSVFDEMEQYKPLNYATTGQRFATYLIDIVVFYLFNMLVFIILVVIAQVTQTNIADFILQDDAGSKIMSYLISLVDLVFIYTITEGLFKGRTLGKLITGTRAVRADGSQITWNDAFKRSLIRMIPFEPLSVFSGNGLWHDRLSKTEVIRTR